MFFKKSDKISALDIKTVTGFEKVYNTYASKVYAICRSKISEPTIAEELVHDIFRSLWERREQLDIKEPVEHYLSRAAKLKIIDHYRQKARDEKYMAHAAINFSDRTNATEETVEYNDLKNQVTNLTNQLSPKSKEVFVLSRENGCTNKEIASRLLITEKAVEYHISKALSCLRSGLVDYSY